MFVRIAVVRVIFRIGYTVVIQAPMIPIFRSVEV